MKDVEYFDFAKLVDNEVNYILCNKIYRFVNQTDPNMMNKMIRRSIRTAKNNQNPVYWTQFRSMFGYNGDLNFYIKRLASGRC